MIASVAFRNFKALRDTRLALTPFNLLIGPNGSGKSSLIQALLRLRTLARLPLKAPTPAALRLPQSPEIRFSFESPFEGLTAVLACLHDRHCDLLDLHAVEAGSEVRAHWPELRDRLLTLRAYLFDHYAMALPTPRHEGASLSSNGGNVAAVLARWQVEQPGAFTGAVESLRLLLPEYRDVHFRSPDGGTVELALEFADSGEVVPGEALSQGTLYVLALCVLAHDPQPPALLCIEEVDRGIHPRLLRSMRDLLYRLSHPSDRGRGRAPAQVLATTHSPYLLDLFRDHPEEVVIAEKHGREASFLRLSDRADLLQSLGDGSLGDLWFSGILGGVPDEP